MKGFRFRQAYAILEKRLADGELPPGEYKFVIGVAGITPKVRGCSLTRDQERVLHNVIAICSTNYARAA